MVFRLVKSRSLRHFPSLKTLTRTMRYLRACVLVWWCVPISAFEPADRLGSYATPLEATPAPHLVLMTVVTWRKHELLSRGSDTSPACFVVQWCEDVKKLRRLCQANAFVWCKITWQLCVYLFFSFRSGYGNWWIIGFMCVAFVTKIDHTLTYTCTPMDF